MKAAFNHLPPVMQNQQQFLLAPGLLTRKGGSLYNRAVLLAGGARISTASRWLSSNKIMTNHMVNLGVRRLGKEFMEYCNSPGWCSKKPGNYR
jgi:hypothetical protein